MQASLPAPSVMYSLAKALTAAVALQKVWPLPAQASRNKFHTQMGALNSGILMQAPGIFMHAHERNGSLQRLPARSARTKIILCGWPHHHVVNSNDDKGRRWTSSPG